LNSTNKYDRGFWGNQSFSAGSFNTFKVNSKIGYSNKGSYHVAKYYHNRSDNDFSFRNASKINDPEEIQKNARYKTSAFLLEHGFRVGKADEINAAVWYEDIYKEIQPPMIREGDELQRDKNIRTSLQWIHNSQGLKWMYRSGYFRYYYRYKDLNEPQYNGMGETHKWVNDAEVRVRLRNNINASFGLNNSYEQAQVDYYEDDPDRMSQSAFISTKFYNIFDRIELVFNGRGELSDGKFLPPVFSVGSHIELPADIVLNASYSKSYQLPTFNDLYWIETKWTKGNENLKPESGHSFEAGLSKDHKHSNLKLHYAISFFTNRIEDMIKWLPNKAAQWRPVNLSMVRSKGIEMKYDVGYEANHWGLKSSTSYSYIDSKSVSKDNNGLYDEKNLVYEPDHSLNQSLRGTWKGWFLTYKHSFTGKRYYDYKHTLPAYHLGNLHAGITIPNQSSELTFSFRINNIWNTDYQVMAWYAMPLRNYLVEIKFKF
jgi:iron complex outermembrane receptor protein